MTRRPFPISTILAAALAASAPATAGAAWTAALPVPDSERAGQPAVAVDGRGDLAVAWVQTETAGSDGDRRSAGTVHVAVRRAGGAVFRSSTLPVAGGRVARDIAIALDGRGEATVAWVEGDGRRRAVRAAFRTPTGRWSAVRSVGATGYVMPALRLAVAPDGTAVLTYNARRTGGQRVAAAWRTRGHAFAAARPVRGVHAVTEPTLVVDPAGTVYLSGLVAGRGGCSGALLTATTTGRRFGARRTIAPAPVMTLQLVTTGRGAAVAAWLAAECNSYEPFAGVLMAAGVHGGRLTGPVTLGDHMGYDLHLSGAPGGAEAGWMQVSGGPQPVLRAARVASTAVVGPAQTRTDGWVAVTADRRGDQLVGQSLMPNSLVSRDLAVRPADGGPQQPAPLTATGSDWTNRTTAATDGAPALAAMTFAGSGLVATVWRPSDTP